jgi:hypothetical protein
MFCACPAFPRAFLSTMATGSDPFGVPLSVRMHNRKLRNIRTVKKLGQNVSDEYDIW